jgi:tetratricopeptide (TPR) repeat protein
MLLTSLIVVSLAVSGQLEQGLALYNSNRFVEARAAFQKAVRGDPADPQARFWLACTYMALDDQESALRRFEPLDKSLGRDPEYLYFISETYTRAARRLANTLVSLGEVARAHQHLAHRYVNAGDWKTAVDELRVAATLRPNVPGLHLEAAQLLWEQKEYDQAAKELEAELAVAPQDFLTNLRYGQYLLRKGRFADAVAPLEIAVRYRKIPEAVLLLAFDFEQMHKPERALAAFNGDLNIFPSNPDIVQMRAELTARYPELRTSKAAFLSPPLIVKVRTTASLRATLDRDPKNEDALYLLSELYDERGAESFERLERIAPDSVRVLQIRGLDAEALGDLKGAEVCYRKVIEKEPRIPGGHYALGHLLRRVGKEAEARLEFERELEIDPYHHLAYFELGAMRLAGGDAQAALPMLEKAVKLRPALADPKVELGKAYLQLKRPADAIPLLKAAIAKEPEHPTAHYLLSRACLMTGATEEGRREVAIHQEIVRKQNLPLRGMTQRQQDESLKAK